MAGNEDSSISSTTAGSAAKQKKGTKSSRPCRDVFPLSTNEDKDPLGSHKKIASAPKIHGTKFPLISKAATHIREVLSPPFVASTQRPVTH